MRATSTPARRCLPPRRPATHPAELGSERQERMPTLEDMIVDDVVHLRRERCRANKPAVAVLTATLNGRLALVTGDGQAH